MYAAVLDADVLHPHVACDLLLRLSEVGLFRAAWSAEILDELGRSLERRHIATDAVSRRLGKMSQAFPDAMAEGVDEFLPTVPKAIHEDDRHVVAAALAARADAIVTNNPRHFPTGPLGDIGIEVQTLDEFLVNQWGLDQGAVLECLREMEADRRRAPRTIPELLSALERQAPRFVDAVRRAL